MASDYKSITDGMLLVAVVIGWSYALDWLGYRVPWSAGSSTRRRWPLLRAARSTGAACARS
jgi:hypothetical protein